MKILIADDEAPLLRFLSRGLSAEGFECVEESALHNLVTRIRHESPSIIVLDRMFGDEDSVELLPAIKSLPNAPMVLLLTAVDEVRERVNGLKQGADDYLCKPFDFDELLARITALGRRVTNAPASNEGLSVGPLFIDDESRIATLNDVEISLTKLEYDVLYYFAENAEKVLSRERILSRVWRSHADPLTNVVDVYISRLRQKLQASNSIVIETLRGNGYRLTIKHTGKE
ncbi:response regulator transcription factor [Alteromonas marina]|uniref:response regulator transcription factor n=1 Tax=unclassified Alteromonas TaxID=2614992 RepID=UPI0012E616F6|nr:response regulator transcription factor [Alteromonas sp. KUL150]GFD71120.1 DNA-binding response regulator [Tenacibaculum sp. KUL113]GFD84136.1 DNA-binding response regulator [Alteromonas sp. KUL150]